MSMTRRPRYTERLVLSRIPDDVMFKVFLYGGGMGDVPEAQQRYALRLGGRERTVEQSPQRVQGWTATRVWNIMRRHGLIRD